MPSESRQQQTATKSEKMLSGELYNSHDSVRTADRLHSAALLHKYNSTPHNPATHFIQLEEILASVGEGSIVRPPFFIDYGYNIRIGRAPKAQGTSSSSRNRFSNRKQNGPATIMQNSQLAWGC